MGKAFIFVIRGEVRMSKVPVVFVGCQLILRNILYMICKIYLVPGAPNSCYELPLTLAVTCLVTTQTRDVTKLPFVHHSAMDVAK